MSRDPSFFKEAKKSVFVVGSTGNQGGAMVRELLKHGKYNVKAMVRDPESDKAKELAALGVEIVVANMDDKDGMVAAMRGSDYLFAYAPHDHTSEDVEGETKKTVQRGLNIAEAAKESGIAHTVFTTGAILKVVDMPQKQVENFLLENVASTILRPVFFMDNSFLQIVLKSTLETGKLKLPLTPDKTFHHIALADIAKYAISVFESPHDWVGQAVEIAGDESKAVDLAGILSKAYDKPIEYERVSIEEFGATYGQGPAFIMQLAETSPVLVEDLPALIDRANLTDNVVKLEKFWGDFAASASESAAPRPTGK